MYRSRTFLTCSRSFPNSDEFVLMNCSSPPPPPLSLRLTVTFDRCRIAFCCWNKEKKTFLSLFPKFLIKMNKCRPSGTFSRLLRGQQVLQSFQTIFLNERGKLYWGATFLVGIEVQDKIRNYFSGVSWLQNIIIRRNKNLKGSRSNPN